MFPIGDDNRGRRSVPYIVYILIALNAIVFILFQGAGMTEEGERFTYAYAVVAREITTGEDVVGSVPVPGAEPVRDPRTGRVVTPEIPLQPSPSPIYLTLLTAMFMHGGWMHIIGNMLYLWVFGDNIEDNFGHLKFVIFYLVCGVIASFAQIMIDPDSPIPSLGASGAIAGVLGSYLIMFPRNRIRNIVALGFIWTTVELPAIVVLGFWIVLQIISQYTASIASAQSSGGVAYMAHIGGFVAGGVLSVLFRNRRPPAPSYNYDYR
jgi:membrane associated rhomboid family serine protease